MQQRTLAELADHVGGRVVGDPGYVISGVATLEGAGPGDITFLSNAKYAGHVATTQAGAVVVDREMTSPAALLVVDDPYYAFTQIVVLLYGHREHPAVGVSPKAHIDPTVRMGADCQIHPFVTLYADVRIGNRCILYPGVFVGPGTVLGDDCLVYANAVIYDGCRLGNRVIVQANATIGQDGFGFATHNGMHHKIPQLGRVIVEDDVEIGSGTVIERGTLADTVVGQGTKIGDTVTIGHGTRIGPHCLLVPQAGIAGSVQIGHHCVIGGQVGVVGHIRIGNFARIGAQAGVIGDVPDGAEIIGSPAIDATKARRAYALIEALPTMRRHLKDLDKRLSRLERPEAAPEPNA